MSRFEQFERVDLTSGPQKFAVRGGLFAKDAGGNRLGLIVQKNRIPVAITGTIQGIAKLPPHTGNSVEKYEFDGVIDGSDPSRVYVDMPAEALYYPGQLTVAIRNNDGNTRTVLATFTGWVDSTTDGTAGVPPSTLPDDIEDFIAELSVVRQEIDGALDEIEEKGEEVLASIPQDYSELSADVSDLKSAFDTIADASDILPFTVAGSGCVDGTNGSIVDVATYNYTNYIPVGAYESLSYRRIGVAVAYSVAGIAFYDSTKTYISGVLAAGSQSAAGYLPGMATVDVPQNAAYIRCSMFADTSTHGDFEIKFNMPLIDKLNTVENAVNNISASDVSAENPSAITTISTMGEWTKSGDTFSLNHTTTGNTWFAYNIDTTVLKSNFLKVVADITLTAGTVMLWIFGKNSAGTNLYLSIESVTESKEYETVIDLNNLVVYQALDMSKPMSVGFSNGTDVCTSSISGFQVLAYNFPGNDATVEDALIRINQQATANANSITYLNGTNGMLKAPNGTTYALAVSNDGTLTAISTIPNKVVFVGNSLLLGNGIGMNASSQNTDYYHHVTSAILALNPSATFEKVNGMAFEGASTVADAQAWMQNTLLPKLGSSVDLVIVQLGDNVTATKLSVFEESCGALISYIRTNAPNARVAWAGEWYSSTARQEIISAACLKYGAVFIDISALNVPEYRSYIGAVIHVTESTTRTYTIDTYTDDSANHVLTVNFTVNGTAYTAELPYTSYTVDGTALSVTGEYIITTDSGVASHPGDAGMLAVANAITNALGID